MESHFPGCLFSFWKSFEALPKNLYAFMTETPGAIVLYRVQEHGFWKWRNFDILTGVDWVEELKMVSYVRVCIPIGVYKTNNILSLFTTLIWFTSWGPWMVNPVHMGVESWIYIRKKKKGHSSCGVWGQYLTLTWFHLL